jgi:hypothetical protein
MVAEISARKGEATYTIAHVDCIDGGDVDAANAHLIEAAPDLLAVVERYVDSQDPCITGGESNPMTCECVACGTTREGRAAIAKARGGK